MRFIYTKAFAIFFSCLVITAVLIFFQVKGWLFVFRSVLLQAPRPIVYVAKNLTAPVKNFFVTIYRLKKISEENTVLSQKVFELQQRLAQEDEYKLENNALRKELGFANSTKLSLQPCTVLAKNFLGFSDKLILNCGTGDGITEGQAIISQGYLVGKIVYVEKGSSTALLITSSNFSSDAKLSKTGSSAIVRGSFGSGLILEELPQSAAVDKGWLVVTAGINQKIPKNILIGEVGDTISSQSDLSKKITLQSPIDFNSLDFVFAVK